MARLHGNDVVSTYFPGFKAASLILVANGPKVSHGATMARRKGEASGEQVVKGLPREILCTTTQT
jgi:hypothetical protein